MDSYRIIKTLKNGYQVPYPEEMIYRDMVFLKDYRLNDYPRDEQGNCRELPYDEYLDWLQNYLYSCNISLSDEQKKSYDNI